MSIDSVFIPENSILPFLTNCGIVNLAKLSNSHYTFISSEHPLHTHPSISTFLFSNANLYIQILPFQIPFDSSTDE